MPQNYPTLMDVARRSGDPGVRDMVEILNQTNYALDDIPWIECNSGVTHITTLRQSLPTPVWRMLNRGVPTGKSTSKQIKVGVGMLEIYAEIDKMQVDLAARNGGQDGAPQFLASENAAFIEGFAQEVSRVMFYGDPANPKEPVGFMHYYNTLGGETKDYVINAGGTGTDNTSIYLVCWGDRTVHGLYPQGSKAGLSEKFLGEHTLVDENGYQFQGYRTHYKWDPGFVVRDYRSISRVCNISMSALKGGTIDAPMLIDMLTEAYHNIPKTAASTRKAFYCRKEVLTALDKQSRKINNLHLSYADIMGREQVVFRGIPLREQESLLDNEPRVV